MFHSKVTVKQASDSPASKEFTRKQFTATFDRTAPQHIRRSLSFRSVQAATAFETASLRKISGALCGGYHWRNCEWTQTQPEKSIFMQRKTVSAKNLRRMYETQKCVWIAQKSGTNQAWDTSTRQHLPNVCRQITFNGTFCAPATIWWKKANSFVYEDTEITFPEKATV